MVIGERSQSRAVVLSHAQQLQTTPRPQPSPIQSSERAASWQSKPGLRECSCSNGGSISDRAFQIGHLMTSSNPILIVEDQPILLLDLEYGLEEGGYAVLSARNAEEAMTILSNDLGRIRALVTDIDIGSTGVNGWDIASRARDGKPDLPVVYMTGASADEWAARGVRDSILLPKPVAMTQVIGALVALLDATPESPSPM